MNLLRDGESQQIFKSNLQKRNSTIRSFDDDDDTDDYVTQLVARKITIRRKKKIHFVVFLVKSTIVDVNFLKA